MNGKDGYGRSDGMRSLFGAAYALMAALPLVLAVPAPNWRLLDAYGKLTAALVLTVFALLSLQPVLAARLRTLDRQFGLDIVYLFHKIMGMTAALAQVCSLAFFTAAPGGVPPAAWAGSVLVVALAGTALLHKELGLTYEAWRKLHNMLFLAVYGAVLFQAWDVGRSLGGAALKAAIAGQAVIAAGAYMLHKHIGPAVRRRGLYRVRSVSAEARNVWTLTFERPGAGRPFDFLPGQFQFITFDEGRGEEHPFTIASSPRDDGTHASTIKGSGDFTRTVGALRPGDLVGIQAAFGRFSHVLEPAGERLVFIAGGIGITPFMSMLRFMRDTAEDRDVVLFYANRSEDDIVFRRELDSIAAALPRLRIVHVLDAPGPGWTGERGRIDRRLIEKHADGFASRLFFLCGPPPMMNVLTNLLIEAGVPPRRIRTERFAL